MGNSYTEKNTSRDSKQNKSNILRSKKRFDRIPRINLSFLPKVKFQPTDSSVERILLYAL